MKRRLGYLPEGAPLYVDMTTAGFLDFVAAIRGLDGADRRRRMADVVERMHLGAVLRQRIETLSKGYRRRVALAQAILHDPDVLILDEPTDGLDPNQKHEVRELIRDHGAPARPSSSRPTSSKRWRRSAIGRSSSPAAASSPMARRRRCARAPTATMR